MKSAASAAGKSKYLNIPLLNIGTTLLKTRGWPFAAAWAHRLTGLIVLVYVGFHILTLDALQNPASFEAKMKTFEAPIFLFLEWLLALPVIYHALNGARLILYETFGTRRDKTLFKWASAFGIIYVVLLGLVMWLGNQEASQGFFWLYTATASVCLALIVIDKIRESGASFSWKLHRITGGFLVLMIPAHMLFMHLNPGVGHDLPVVTARMGSVLIKLIDASLVIAVLCHGSYGLYSICQDYLASQTAKAVAMILILLAAIYFAWIGLRLTVLI